MIRTVIFDFDGTIADSLEIIIRLFNDVSSKYDLPQIKESDYDDLRGKSAHELVKQFKVTPLKLLMLSNEIRKNFREKVKDAPSNTGIKELIWDLHKNDIKVGIVTSNSKENVEVFLKNNKIENVDFIHSEKNLFGKGNVLNNVITAQGLNHLETFYVGDEVRDIDAARKSGIQIISVTWGFNDIARIEKASPDFIVSKPSEVLKIVKG